MSIKDKDVVDAVVARAIQKASEADLERARAKSTVTPVAAALPTLGAVTGKLVALLNKGCTPLVAYQGQPGPAALAARTVVDLSAAHIGCDVVLIFEESDPARPVIMGLLRDGSPNSEQMEVVLDGGSVIVTAKQQLTIRCGKASVTLTEAGKVLIQGEYVISRSRRTNRIEGGTVQIN